MGLILVLILVKQTSDYTIIEVKDGNTLLLESGTTVKLIGITSTIEGQEYLKQHFLNKQVNLLCDKSAPFDPTMIGSGDVVYAYVLGGDYANLHLNAILLREGCADVQEGTYLNDSLLAFRQYASYGSEKRGITPPSPTPIPEIIYKEDDIILPAPPQDKKLQRKHSAWYTDGNLNLEMLDEACDYLCPYTKQFANSLAAKSSGPFNIGQICEIFEYCYKKWTYVNDPIGHEYLATASETIEGNLAGDCDDFAVLMATCILAVGGNVCINTGHNAGGGHAFTEVDIAAFGQQTVLEEIQQRFSGFSVSQLNTRRDGNHLWLNLDWQSAYPGGKYYDCSYSRDAYPCVNGVWSWEKLN